MTNSPEKIEDQESLTKLNKVSQDGVAPKRRMTDAYKARNLGWQLVYANRARSDSNARVQGLIDGNPPMSQAKLRTAGQAWRTNQNFGEARATASAAMTPLYDLFSAAKRYVGVETSYGRDENEQSEFSDKIGECIDATLREDWPDFNATMQGVFYDRTIMGKGFLVWFNSNDWRCEWVDYFQVYAPERAKASLSKVPFVMVRQSYEVWELWENIVNEKSAADVGWNVEGTKLAIQRAYPKKQPNEAWCQYEEIQRWIKDNELWEGIVAETVNVFHFFVREFDGSVSHLICEERESKAGDRKETEEEQPWLFESIGKYDEMQNSMAAFFHEPLNAKWNGSTGLGKAMYGIMELKNRGLCQTFDLTMLRSGLTLQCKTPEAQQKLNLIQWGAFNIIPSDFEVVQGQLMGDVTSPIATNRLLDEIVTRNTGTYRARMEAPSGNPRTAREVEIENGHASELSVSSVDRAYIELDAFGTETFRRMKTDKKFLKRLDDAGVPREAIAKVGKVFWVRAVGNGSQWARKAALEQMAPIVPMLPEKGRIAWLQDRVASVTSWHQVPRYVPTEDDAMKGNDAWAAGVEHVMMGSGQMPLVTDMQDHVIHSMVHLAAGAQALASAGQLPPNGKIQAANFVDFLGKHVAQHLAMIQNDPARKQDFASLMQQWKKMASMNDQFRAMIEKMSKQHVDQVQQQQQEQQAQQQPAPDPELATKMVKARAEIQMKGKKNDQQMAIKAQKEQQQMNVTALKAKQNMAIADAQAAAKIARDHAAAQSKASKMKQ